MTHMAQINISETRQTSAYPIFVIGLCACFLFYKYVLQIFPSIITNELMQEYHLTGAGLGNLAATFYYSYTLTQLFVGILLDKFSTRWLTSLAIFCCALGVYLFSAASDLATALLSRGLMGAGVAFATVSYMKLAATWFPPKQYAFVAGLLATAAMAGAVFGQAPLAWVINNMGWRQTLGYVGIVGFGLAALFAVFVRDSNRHLETHHTEQKSFSLSDLFQIFKKKENWILTLYSGLAFSPIAIFGGLWGNPFVEQAYHLSKTQAASLISLVFIGLGLGSPLFGIFSDRLGHRRNTMLIGTSLSFLCIVVILYFNSMPIWILSALLFLFGFGIGSFMIVFTMGKELNNVALTATVIAMINTSDAILDSFTEPFIGKLLDFFWDGKVVNGVHYFSLHSYYFALSLLPIYLGLAILLLLCLDHK